MVLCNSAIQSENNNKVEDHASGLPILNVNKNINFLMNLEEATLFTTPEFSSIITKLTNHFDQVVVCANAKNARLALMALKEFSPALVLIAGLRKTKKVDIRNIIAKQPVDLLFYD